MFRSYEKCVLDEYAVVSLEYIQVDERLNYVERPIAILKRKVKVLCGNDVPLVKVQWQHRRGSEWPWEPEVEMQEYYPDLFTATSLEDEA